MKLTKTHRAYFEAAKACAQLSDFPRVAVGAVAIYKHHIISSGYNSQKTDTLQKKYNRYRFLDETPHSVHAELSCLKPLIGRKDINFNEISLYIYRECKDGTLGLARPCESCFKLITDLGIRDIYYSNGNNGFSHEEILY